MFKPKLLQGKARRLCYITSTPYFDTKDVVSSLIYICIIEQLSIFTFFICESLNYVIFGWDSKF